MVNFPTQVPDYDSYNPALLDLFLSSDASICSTIAFPPLVNSGHVAVSVSIDFPSNSKRDVPFHCIAYDYSCAGWDVLCNNLRDVPCSIPHRNYLVKFHSSPWFSAACAAAIVHRKHFFHLHQQNKSSESKGKFRHTSNRC